MTPTSQVPQIIPEPVFHLLRQQTLEYLHGLYSVLVKLYDRPIEHIERTMTYTSKEQLVTSSMTQINAVELFARQLGLLTGTDERDLFEQYRSQRPDIFGAALPPLNAGKSGTAGDA